MNAALRHVLQAELADTSRIMDRQRLLKELWKLEQEASQDQKEIRQSGTGQHEQRLAASA